MKMMNRWSVLLSGILLVALVMLWWFVRGGEETRRVDMTELVTGEVEPRPKEELRVAVAAMISPKETENRGCCHFVTKVLKSN